MKRTIWLPYALPHQIPILLSPARKKIVICGRKWGKTPLGLIAALRGHGPHRGYRRGAVDGASIAWVAPNFTVASEIWRDLKRACNHCWIRKSEEERRIDLLTGGTVRVCSADAPDSLRGPNRHGVILDEAAYMPHYLWTHVLRPQLAATRGWWMFLTTPNGMNWIHDEFNKAAHDPLAERWQRPSFDNPLVTPSELEEMRLDMGPRGYAQEVEAHFVESLDSEWPNSYFTDSIWFDHWPDRDITCKVMALDPSLGANERSDMSAIIMMVLTRDGAMWVDADIQRRDVAQICRDSIALARRFRPVWFGVESNGFQKLLAGEIVRISKQEGLSLPIMPMYNHEPKLTRIRAITAYLARGEIHFLRNSPGAKLLVDQLKSFPLSTINDDGPDALAMAIVLLQRLLFGPPPDDNQTDIILARAKP